MSHSSPSVVFVCVCVCVCEPSFRRKTDAGEPQGGWQHVSEPVQLTTLRGDDVQSSWKVSPQQTEAGTRHASIGWSPPPATDPASIEYKIEMETEAGGKEEVVVPGEQHTHTIRAVNGVALSPSSSFPVRVSYRSKAAANQPGGGWGHMSPTLACNTAAAPPDGWRVPLAAGDATPDSVALVWEHPEHVPTHSAEYVLRISCGSLHRPHPLHCAWPGTCWSWRQHHPRLQPLLA